MCFYDGDGFRAVRKNNRFKNSFQPVEKEIAEEAFEKTLVEETAQTELHLSITIINGQCLCCGLKIIFRRKSPKSSKPKKIIAGFSL